MVINILYLEDVETNQIKAGNIISGAATIRCEPEKTYNIYRNKIKPTMLDNLNDDYLYLNPSLLSIDKKQTVITPNEDGNVDLIWQKYPNYASISRWRKYQEIIAENRANGLEINYDRIDLFGMDNTKATQFGSCILLPNGNILGIPPNENGVSFSIIDPYALTITPFGIDLTTLTKNFRLGGAVILPNGLVYIANTGTVGYECMIVDPIAKTTTFLPDADNSYSWFSLLLPDGKVFNLDSFSIEDKASYIYDYLNNTYTPFGNQLNNFYTSGLLHPNGKMFLTSRSNMPCVMDMNTEAIMAFGVHDSNRLANLVLLENEEILLIYHIDEGADAFKDGNYILTHINPETLERTNVRIPPVNKISRSLIYDGGILLPDGNVHLSSSVPNPYSIEKILTYNPYNKTMRELIYNFGYNTRVFTNSILLPDGRIFKGASTYANCMIISASDGNYGVLPDLDTCLSPYVSRPPYLGG